jgi:hypothetical protein
MPIFGGFFQGPNRGNTGENRPKAEDVIFRRVLHVVNIFRIDFMEAYKN